MANNESNRLDSRLEHAGIQEHRTRRPGCGVLEGGTKHATRRHLGIGLLYESRNGKDKWLAGMTRSVTKPAVAEHGSQDGSG